MKIVLLKGGLGNQMFQYAFYKKLSSLFDDVFLDKDSRYLFDKSHNGFELDNIFNIEENFATLDDIIALSGNKHLKLKIQLYNAFNFIFNKIHSPRGNALINFFFTTSKLKLQLLKREFIKNDVSTDCFIKNLPNYFLEKPGVFYSDYANNINYYDGYWQDVRYFSDVIEELKADFSIKDKLDETNNNIIKQISDKGISSVSIHVRRGDRSNDYDLERLKKYYFDSIHAIEERINDPVYFVFSDNINWVKENLNILSSKQCIYVSHNKRNKSYIDFYLMSLCKHNIIANSSFSWWSALLNNNISKIITCPQYYTFNKNANENMKMVRFPAGYNVVYL